MSLLYSSRLYLLLGACLIDSLPASDGVGETGGVPRVSCDDARRMQIETVGWMRERGGQTILLNLPLNLRNGLPGSPRFERAEMAAHKAVPAQVARESGAVLVDVYQEWSVLPGSLDPLFLDWVHPNAEGHRRIAARLLDTIVRNRMLDAR